MAIVGIAKPFKWFLKFPHFSKKTKKSQNIVMPMKAISKGSLKTDLQPVFRFFDSNDDGKISNEELRSYFASTGECMSHDEVQKAINEFDGNGDGLLEFMEFIKLVEGDGGNEKNDNNNDDDDGVRRAFEMFEVEKGCGFITAKGVQRVLNQLGDEKSEEECEGMIRVFDLDGNGVLDFHEFRKMME